jgi:hypothetical protein
MFEKLVLKGIKIIISILMGECKSVEDVKRRDVWEKGVDKYIRDNEEVVE